MPDDDQPTEAEQREAEALARAFERGHARADLPDDALEAAHLLQYSRDGGALDEKRSEAILTDVLERAKPPQERRPARSFWRGGWLGLGAATAAAAAGIALWVATPDLEKPAALPAPPKRLLQAQMEAAAPAAPDKEARTQHANNVLDEPLRGYRLAVYDTLEERYRP